jgi:hypothetical protein
MSRNTVEKMLASDVPPRYQRPVKGSIVDTVGTQIRRRCASSRTCPSTVIRCLPRPGYRRRF